MWLSDLMKMRQGSKANFTSELVGPGTADKQFKVLNRVITFVDNGDMFDLIPDMQNC